MSLAAPYQEHYYIADGEMVTFPFGEFFQPLSQNYVKCAIYFDDGTSCIPTFTVDMENQQITIVTLTKPDGTVLTVPPAGSVVRVYRETPEQQNVTASQLQNYTAKQLEKIFDSMVAMQQETSYSDLHKNIRLTEPQRDISIEPLTEEKDQSLLYWDEESRQIKSTEYGQDEVIEQIERANTVADEAKTIAGKARDDLRDHEMDKGNPHETSMAKLTDTEIVDPERFQFLSFDGTKWKNVNYSATYTWGGIGGDIADQTDLFDTFVKKTGDTVSGMYKHSYGSRTRYLSANNTNKYMDVFMNDDIFTLYYHYTNSSTATLSMRSYVDGHFNIYPSSDKGGTIGFPSRRFEKIYTTHLCGSTNGNNYLIVPDVGHSDTIATKSQVDLAANSGRMITDQGVWYAKMYAATVAPSAEDGTNYADFSQTDGQGNPIIVTYNRVNGAWVQDQTITPPAEYDGYVPITSKIWDIAEQAGQQGGRILWNHQSKDFTPYPQIISYENIEITGDSTVIMPQNPSTNQIVNKNYVDNLISDTGTGRNVGDIFYTKRTDNELNGAVECNGGTYDTTDFTGAESIGALLEAGKIDFISLTAYADAITQKGWCDKIGWNGTGNTQFRVPTLTAYIAQKTLGLVTTTSVNHVGGSTPMRLGTINTSTAVNRTQANPLCTFGDDGIGTNGAGGSAWGSQHEKLAPINLVVDASEDMSEQRVMIQLAISATDEAVMTCTNITAQVAANTSAINGADYVVESQLPTALNNYTWYRKYKSGWVEQGGQIPAQAGGSFNVTFPVEMADTNYHFLGGGSKNSTDSGFIDVNIYNTGISTTGFTALLRYAHNGSTGNPDERGWWEVKGMAAN